MANNTSMIKFLRKIRQHLLSENKFSKYTLYAIGEIVLVTIGILLALQINNWNERQNENKVELKMLRSLKADLQRDILNLQNKINSDSTIAESNKELLKVLREQDGTFNAGTKDRVNSWGLINRFDIFYHQTFAYESLKSEGLTVIKNDSLQEKIVQLYDYTYGITGDIIRIQRELYFNTNPFLLNYLETKGFATVKEPNDIEGLLENQEFINYLSHIYGENIQFLEYFRQCLERVKAVKFEVEKELRTKDK